MKRLRLFGVGLTLGLVIASSGCVSSVNWPSRFGLNNINHEALNTQLNLARLSERHGQTDQARTIYETVLKSDPNNQMAHHRLGVMAAKDAKLAEAESHFRRAAEVAPPSSELLNDIGYTLYLQDRLEEAEHSIRQAVERDPKNLQAHNNLGLVLGEMGRTDESLAEFKIAGKEAEAYNNLGYAASQAGNVAAAEQYFNRALTLDPSQRQAAEALLQLTEMKTIVQKAHDAKAQVADNGAQPAVAANAPAGRRPAASASMSSRPVQPSAARQSLAGMAEQPARKAFEADAADRTNSLRSAYARAAAGETLEDAAPTVAETETRKSLLAHALSEIKQNRAAGNQPAAADAALAYGGGSTRQDFQPAQIVTPEAALRSKSRGGPATASLGDGNTYAAAVQVSHNEQLISSETGAVQKADPIPVFKGPGSTRRATWNARVKQSSLVIPGQKAPEAGARSNDLRGADEAGKENAEPESAPQSAQAPGGSAVALSPWQSPTWVPNGSPFADSDSLSPATLPSDATTGISFGGSVFTPESR